MLPAGFTSRELARGGHVVPGTGYIWPAFPDGGATFRAPGGWIYVANSELAAPAGGVSAIRFDARRQRRRRVRDLRGHRSQLRRRRDAVGHVAHVRGGRDGPRVGVRPARRRAGASAATRWARSSTRPWPSIRASRRSTSPRTSPTAASTASCRTRGGDLSSGARSRWRSVEPAGASRGLPVPNPNPVHRRRHADAPAGARQHAVQRRRGHRLRRDHVYFTTKGDNRVWDYDTATQR